MKPAEENVWQVVMRSSEIKRALQPFLKALPRVLEDYLGKLVCVETIQKARIAFLKYCLNSGYAEAFVSAMQEEPREEFGIDREFIERELRRRLVVAVEIGTNVSAYLSSHFLTERIFLCNCGLSGEALSLYNRGELTVGRLLDLQPEIFVIVEMDFDL